MAEMIKRYRIILDNLKAGDCSGDQGVDGRIILNWIFKERCMKIWTESNLLGVESSGGFF
jgi:hypothetical protein